MTSLVLLAARLPCGKVVGRRLDRLSVNQLALADDDDILGTCETGRHFDPDPIVDVRRDADLASHALVDHEDRFGRTVRDQRRRRNHQGDRKSTRLNSSHGYISYAVFCLKKK